MKKPSVESASVHNFLALYEVAGESGRYNLREIVRCIDQADIGAAHKYLERAIVAIENQSLFKKGGE